MSENGREKVWFFTYNNKEGKTESCKGSFKVRVNRWEFPWTVAVRIINLIRFITKQTKDRCCRVDWRWEDNLIKNYFKLIEKCDCKVIK